MERRCSGSFLNSLAVCPATIRFPAYSGCWRQDLLAHRRQRPRVCLGHVCCSGGGLFHGLITIFIPVAREPLSFQASKSPNSASTLPHISTVRIVGETSHLEKIMKTAFLALALVCAAPLANAQPMLGPGFGGPPPPPFFAPPPPPPPPPSDWGPPPFFGYPPPPGGWRRNQEYGWNDDWQRRSRSQRHRDDYDY